ncbi:MAG: alpha-mannosidase [Ruminococcaceae bacterium]|nr:alpha-mannosidase [Oscillospiraceae bacterium]
MKEVHLICNAHLDPIWQWEWEEGAAAALSTFRAAADLADEFDYIFCHNEVTLYKYIEEYAPALFSKIKRLIREGRWHIMGGWYLQPDCNMPSGESFVRQILVGHRYFAEKFGVNPTTAINFDAFGHSSGLPQIISKCGQDSLILARPGNDPIPARQFVWEGVDGSQIKVFASNHGYNSPLGHAAEAIRNRMASQEEDVICVLWGVGNHGGGPSRRDLGDIDAMKAELGDSVEILHSTPEHFFAKLDPEVIHRGALRTVMPGCYTSMVQIKQKHAALENALYTAEKLCSAAALRGLIEYPEKELDEVTEDLLNAEFHDILPGSSVRAGEENGLQLLDHGLLLCSRLRARAYFALSGAQPRAAEGEFPVLVFNPNPYEWETEIVCEMMLADQNWSDTVVSHMRVCNEAGEVIAAQVIKEESNLNLDWRKRFVFRAPLRPMDITRFSVYVDFEDAKEKTPLARGGDFVFDASFADGGRTVNKHIEIDGKTGLLRSFVLDGRELISDAAPLGVRGAFLPVFYEDNPDPWGMGGFQLSGMGRNPQTFALMDVPEGETIKDGPFVGMMPVQVTEDGAICTVVECFFRRENTHVRMEYTLYKTRSAIDVRADVFMGDADRMLKLALPLTDCGDVIGQTAFGTEVLYRDGRENVAQRFVGLRGEGGAVTVLFNRGTYGSSYENGVLSMSLVRGASYCAHPINNRPIIPSDKFVKKIDMGERDFFFRLDRVGEASLERLAWEYNVPPYACNVFPAESGLADTVPAAPVVPTVSDRDIVLITMKKQHGADMYLMRLLNNSAQNKDCVLSVGGKTVPLRFGRYEVKTVRYDGTGLAVSDRIEI